MERNHFRKLLSRACWEIAAIALGTWVAIIYVDEPHWVLLVVCVGAIAAAFIATPKTSGDDNNGTLVIEEKHESQQGAWRSLWREFWNETLPYHVREFLGASTFVVTITLLMLVFYLLGQFQEWVRSW